MIRLLSIAMLLVVLAAPLTARAEFTRHALTLAMVQKHQAATRELEKTVAKKDEDEDDEKDGMTVDELARELDATPGVKPVLARHGLTSRSYALTTLALFEAGFHLMMEPSMSGKAGQALASYPPEMRANIELLRKNPQLLGR
ncbi:hypothetical protein [Ramlibacter rhizophilus]|uniref:Uncharacterized protein n=1 Tax=Ramlibacter rhizophilus TaxID=1781167 RepID=A0A4Z0BFB5_9BURK|nr:hypothetical protein [Ramlibacter rhizophilus]TFY97510.1 hypothetical protein EZ242_18495 [Ramlibacter rhizophilus]